MHLNFGVLQNGYPGTVVVVAVAIFGFEFLALSQISVLANVSRQGEGGDGKGQCSARAGSFYDSCRKL